MVANNPTTENVEELELAERAYAEEMYKNLMELYEDKRFQKVILEGYLKDKAVDQVSLLATPYVRHNNLRGAIMEELVAISALEGYFKNIETLGAPVEEDGEDIEFEG
jgi:hypothetical protein